MSETNMSETNFNRSSAGRRSARIALPLGGLAIVAALAGCGDFSMRRELGLIGTGPDPFTVVRNKSLEMPTDTAALPAPKPGAKSLVEPTPEDDARRALVGDAPATSAAPSAAEAALIRRAGAEGADDQIRKDLTKEVEDDDGRLLDGVIDSIVGDDEEGEPLDPAEEARRLAEDARRTKNPDLIVPTADD